MNELKFNRLPKRRPKLPVRPAHVGPPITDLESLETYIQGLNNQPLTRANAKFVEFVNQCVNDPDFRDEKSQILLDFLMMSRDLLTDGINEKWSMDDILAPIFEAMGKLSAKDGAMGGRAPKRRRWADIIADEYCAVGENSKIWQALERAHDSSSPYEIELDDTDLSVYVDADRLIAVDQSTGREQSLAKSTFFDEYIREARKRRK